MDDALMQVCDLLNTNNALLVGVLCGVGVTLGLLLIRELWNKW